MEGSDPSSPAKHKHYTKYHESDTFTLMRVLEIGCGDEAGPCFDGASEHIASDIDETAVANSMRRDPRFTPLIADATDLHALANKSIDVVLARNVFGSPLLGFDHQRMLQIIHSRLAWPDYKAIFPEVETRKLAIMQEAARLLASAGKLIIVEELTPRVAVGFFKRLQNNNRDQRLNLSMSRLVHISSITPTNYAQRHRIAKTWVSYPR